MRTHIIYRKELFLSSMVYIIVCTGLAILFLEIVKSQLLSIVSLMAILAPLLAMPILLRRYTKEMYVELEPNQFRFRIFDSRPENEKIVELQSMISYSIQAPNDRFYSVKFILSNSRKLEFSFFKKKKDDADIDAVELIGNMQKRIVEFNKQGARTIVLIPSFFASNAGLYCILGLSLILFAAVLLAIFLNKGVPLTFVFSLLLIFQMVWRRNKEMEYFKAVRDKNVVGDQVSN